MPRAKIGANVKGSSSSSRDWIQRTLMEWQAGRQGESEVGAGLARIIFACPSQADNKESPLLPPLPTPARVCVCV